MISSGKLPLPHYESHDASLRLVGLMALTLIGLIVLSLGVSAWMFPRHDARTPASPLLAGKTFQYGTAWQSSISRDWVELDRRTQQNLTTYGWIDRKTGVVRIPVDRAMELVAKESQP